MVTALTIIFLYLVSLVFRHMLFHMPPNWLLVLTPLVGTAALGLHLSTP
jgi:hypothetical protein